ncbi:MAG: excinuclease ABC subunit UvrC [Methylobacteriaceae bacterium]|nr:excinuclease ABC subunit UvrC [Methylobacteriaceae bacterium]
MTKHPVDAPPEDVDVSDDSEQSLPGIDLDLSAETAAGPLARGVEVIRTYWKHAPFGPGVYRMIAVDGEVLYVGKAKSVKKRIASYMRGEGHTNRIARMIALTASMVFVSTETEPEALLLETNLIKQLKPRFNVLMRDDKSFPYILLTRDHAAPQIAKHRGARNRKGDYFGPFASAQAVGRTLNALQRAFLLRSCTDSYYENRTRPCLLFQIKRCAGPCTGEISHVDYGELVREAHDFLSGKSRAVRDLLAREMGEAAEKLDFERAARLRDRIAALSAIQGSQGVNPRSVEEADVFAIAEEAGQFCVEIFFFRTGQNWGNRAYFPRADKSLSKAEVLGAFVAQFYDERPAPSLVLLNEDVDERVVLSAALSTRAGRKVEVAAPQRGEKRELVDQAAANARQTLSRKLAEAASQEKLLGALGQAFGIDRPIRRVEVYDNSHIMGTNAIGAMIVAGRNGFMKTHYRTFNIKSQELTPGDDFGMMREVLRRRFARLAKEEGGIVPASTDPHPEEAASAAVSKDGRAENVGDAILRDAPDGAPQDEGPGLTHSPLAGRGQGEGLVGEEELFEVPSNATGPSSGPPGHLLPAGEPGVPGSPTQVAEVGSSRLLLGEKDETPDPDAFPSRPDLVVIDGGKGQFDAARAAMAEVGITDIPVVSIAKGADRDSGREMFFVAGREPFRMGPRDPALYFVQRLRDEAHRFAIGTHRARRKKEFTKSPLDEIAGVGPARKRALLAAFGTAKAVSQAALADLEKTPGVNAATARLVYAHFHEKG